MKRELSQFLVAAPASGSGKTTVAVGLMAAFARRGLRVQPFKCGPDYIDTKFHAAACRRPSYNLDLFMASASHVRQVYAKAAQQADVCVVEGMMGLFDGYLRQQGSPADVAATLRLPVVVVVDASHTGYSVAPLLQGLAQFDARVHVVGAIYNKVGSERHAMMLREACQDVGMECFGCIPRQRQAENASRYLGLDFSSKADVDALADLVERYVDTERLRKACRSLAPDLPEPVSPVRKSSQRILVARNDESFSFLYQQHIDLLATLGTLEYFNPETDFSLPSDTSLLYLPGGYPEKHLEVLERAAVTRQSIRDYARRGGRIIAECGGMMYLCRDIVTDEGSYPMCGVLPYSISARTADRHLSLGYRRVVLEGKAYRGHEFHYTQFVPPGPPSAAEVFDARGNKTDSPFIFQDNILASYTHLYWESPAWLSLLLNNTTL